MRVHAVDFQKSVKFPTGDQGHGRNFERFADDHPENPNRDFVLTWDDAAQELVVFSVKSGHTVGVPRSNIAHIRPAIGKVAREQEAAFAAKGAKK